MIKTIKKIGNSKGIILDAALLDLTHLKEGDQLSVTLHEGGAMTFTPINPRLIPVEEAKQAVERIVINNDELFKRLSK